MYIVCLSGDNSHYIIKCNIRNNSISQVYFTTIVFSFLSDKVVHHRNEQKRVQQYQREPVVCFVFYAPFRFWEFYPPS